MRIILSLFGFLYCNLNMFFAQELPRLESGIDHSIFDPEELHERKFRKIQVLRTVEDPTARSRTTDTCYLAEFDSLYRLHFEKSQYASEYSYSSEIQTVFYGIEGFLERIEHYKFGSKYDPYPEKTIYHYNKNGQRERLIIRDKYRTTEYRWAFDKHNRKESAFLNGIIHQRFYYYPFDGLRLMVEYFESWRGDGVWDSVSTTFEYDSNHRLLRKVRRPSATFRESAGLVCGRDLNGRNRSWEYDSLYRVIRACSWGLNREIQDSSDCSVYEYRTDSIGYLTVNTRREQNTPFNFITDFSTHYERDEVAPEVGIIKADEINDVVFFQTFFLENSKLPLWKRVVAGKVVETYEFIYSP